MGGIEVTIGDMQCAENKERKLKSRRRAVEGGGHIMNARRARFTNLLGGVLSAILKTPPRRPSSYVYALFTHRDIVVECMC